MKRVFSRQTYNGYHLVNISGDGEDPSPIGFFKKSGKKDEYGFLVDEEDQPKCKEEVNTMFRPWGEFIIVPSVCQHCDWLYQTPRNDYNCLLITKDKAIRPSALRVGRP